MSKIDKTKPDVLRVTEFILSKNKLGDSFSVCEAAKTPELNGINEYRIAEIMRDICLEPNGPNSIEELTRVSNDYSHNQSGNWQLNASTYFGYLSYLSVKESEKSNHLAVKTLRVAIATIIVSVLIPLIAA